MARVDYSSWTRLSLSVSNLKLDKKNPRIPYYIPTRTTRDILSYLFEHEEIERLADKIVDKGFINHDPIYVIKENDNYVVIEGNRRISALKCLQDPSQIPITKLRRKFEKLKNKLGNEIIEKVDVYVAPSRIDAQNVLFELHAEGKLQLKVVEQTSKKLFRDLTTNLMKVNRTNSRRDLFIELALLELSV